MSSHVRLEMAIKRLRRSRNFTKMFLPDITPQEWFWCPPSYITHVAWQVGHLAVAEYNLCLRRVRGRTADDESLISETFIEAFRIGSQPVAGEMNNLPLDTIKSVFDNVHDRALAELPLLSDAEVEAPVEPPHAVFKTKLGAIGWSSQHELIHAGQIAMLRRLMGKAPLR